MIKYSDTVNVSAHSVEQQICDLKAGNNIGSGTKTKHTGGPSTIVVMMNGNSNQIYPSYNYDNSQLSMHPMSHVTEESPNTSKQFLPRSTSTEKYTIDDMPFQEKVNGPLQR